MIKTVIRLRNDMVIVFDESGEQIAESQAFYPEVMESILAGAPAGAAFNHQFGHFLEPETVTGESW